MIDTRAALELADRLETVKGNRIYGLYDRDAAVDAAMKGTK